MNVREDQRDGVVSPGVDARVLIVGDLIIDVHPEASSEPRCLLATRGADVERINFPTLPRGIDRVSTLTFGGKKNAPRRR